MSGRRRLRLVGIAVLVAGLAIGSVPLGLRTWAAVRERRPAEAIAPSAGRFVDAGLATYVQERGPADGLAVVFVPGTMAWSGTFVDVVDRLPDVRTVAIDLPPFGFTARPDGHDYGRRAQAARIGATLDALGLDRVVLVGHSFGAGATVEAAFTLGDRVVGLVLLDGALGLQAPVAAVPVLLRLGPVRGVVVASTFTNPLGTASAIRAMVHDDAIVTPDRVARYQLPYAVQGTTHAVGGWLVTGLYADERGARSGTEAAYRAFDRPTLLVWGRQDDVTPLSQGEHLAGLFPASRLVVLDGVNHIPHVEAPDATAAAIRAFVNDISPSPTPR